MEKALRDDIIEHLADTILTLEEIHDQHIYDDDDEHPDDCEYCALVKRLDALRVKLLDKPAGRLPALAIVVEGGNVAAIISDDPAAVAAAIEAVTVIDYDVEGCDEENLTWVRQDDETWSEAVVSERTVEFATIGLDDFREYLPGEVNGGDPSVTDDDESSPLDGEPGNEPAAEAAT